MVYIIMRVGRYIILYIVLSESRTQHVCTRDAFKYDTYAVRTTIYTLCARQRKPVGPVSDYNS